MSSKRNQKCGILSYKCENCNHEVELHLNAKTVKKGKVMEQKQSSLAGYNDDESYDDWKTFKKKPRSKNEKQENPKSLQQVGPEYNNDESYDDWNFKKKPRSKQQVDPEYNEKLSFNIEEMKKRVDSISVDDYIKALEIEEVHDLPLCVKLKYEGFWITNTHDKHVCFNDETCDRNSVMLTNDCLLYVYKLALRHYLLSKQIISPYDIDAQNLVPHVVIRKGKNDANSKYKSAKNEDFIITEEMITVKSDFLLVELDVKRDLHMTLIYNKKIKSKVDLLEALKIVIRNLNLYPSLIKDYANLDYFGYYEMDYWYNDINSYPLHVKKPLNYIPTEVVKTIPQNITAAGSIIS